MRLRRRAAVKWAALALSVTVVAAMVGSWRYWLVLSVHLPGGRDTRVFKIADGVAGCYPDPMAFGVGSPTSSRLELGPPPRWHIKFWTWRPQVLRVGDRWTSVYVPLYLPALALASLTGLLFHRDRRGARWSREGRCTGCGYDSSGLPRGAACPECGRAATI